MLTRASLWLRASRSWPHRLGLLAGVAALVGAFLVVATQSGPVAYAADRVSFTCLTGNATYTVPAGVTELAVQVAGAPGSTADGSGGGAGHVSAVIPVQAGQTIKVVVGCGQAGFHSGGNGGTGT